MIRLFATAVNTSIQKSIDHITNYSAKGIIFDVPQQLLEVEVLEEDPADVVVVDRVQDLLLRQGLKLQIGVLIVVSLISTIVNPVWTNFAKPIFWGAQNNQMQKEGRT